MLLFPQLRKHDAERRFEEIREVPLSQLRVREVHLTDDVCFTPSGGPRISARELTRIRKTVLEIARQCGFPDRARDAEKSNFDATCAIWLLTETSLEAGEASRDAVWAYLTLELMPDIAAWRFSNRNARRFMGGVRNTFQRLWRRAFLLDHTGDLQTLRQALSQLQEDSFVQLIERPGSSANPFVASRIAAAWIRTAAISAIKPMEGVHRLVMKELTQIGAVVCLDCLDESELDSLLDRLYLEFARSP